MDMQFLSKYRTPLIIFLGSYLVLVLFAVYALMVSPVEEFFDMVPIVPFKNQYYDGLAIFLLYPVVASIGALIGSYLLAPFYLWIHKLLFGKMIYGVQKEPPPDAFKQTFRGWYPTLLAFHINSILLLAAPDLTGRMLGTLDSHIEYGVGNLTLMILTLGAGFMVFSAAWGLIDAGIMYSTKKHVEGKGMPTEGRTVGGWFHDYLRGYAGFGIALSYIWLLVEAYLRTQANIVEIIFMFATPLFITLSTIPTPIFLEETRYSRIRYLRRIASKQGIEKTVRIYFEEVS
jgi:hypothetical protein